MMMRVGALAGGHFQPTEVAKGVIVAVPLLGRGDRGRGRSYYRSSARFRDRDACDDTASSKYVGEYA